MLIDTNRLAQASQPHRLKRDDARDLAFDGWLLGEGHLRRPPVGTVVSIFATCGGKVITHVRQYDEDRGDDTHRAAVHDSGAEAYDWLVADGGGRLGSASRLAWENATHRLPALEEDAVEVIE